MESVYQFRVVASGFERDRAIQLIDANYLRDLGHIPQDEYDASAIFVIAMVSDGSVIGALRLLPPSSRPFDCEHYVDLDCLLPEGRVPALIGRMAVDPGHRSARKGQTVQLGLLREACALSRNLKVTDLVLYTYPELAVVYEAVLFERLPASFYHPRAQAEMVLLRLDLESLFSDNFLTRTGRFLIGSNS